MAKLRGKAKAAFLAKMAAGRKRSSSSRKRRKRRNPELLTVNPARSGLAAALSAYQQFHGMRPQKATKLGNGKGVLIALGELREIVYQPRRGDRKGPAWFHKFKPGNVLAVTADGKKLVIVDRRRRRAVDFDRGIVN